MIFDNIDIEEIKQHLINGLSFRKIGDIYKCNYKKIEYLVNKNKLIEYSKYKKPIYKNKSYFNKIDTPEKAYILGFLIGDGHISTNDKLNITIGIKDREVLEFISNELGANIQDYNHIDIKKKIFPNSQINIGDKQLVCDIKKLFGGRLKEERRLPIISKQFEIFLLIGFFDAEGCITFGYRKDRNRLWQKISFTSQHTMLIGIQNILLKYGIATSIKPKGNEKCYILEFSNKKNVLDFIKIIKNKNLGLKRKQLKLNELEALLRPESGEFGETILKNAIPSQSINIEGVETK